MTFNNNNIMELNSSEIYSEESKVEKLFKDKPVESLPVDPKSSETDIVSEEDLSLSQSF